MRAARRVACPCGRDIRWRRSPAVLPCPGNRCGPDQATIGREPRHEDLEVRRAWIERNFVVDEVRPGFLDERAVELPLGELQESERQTVGRAVDAVAQELGCRGGLRARATQAAVLVFPATPHGQGSFRPVMAWASCWRFGARVVYARSAMLPLFDARVATCASPGRLRTVGWRD